MITLSEAISNLVAHNPFLQFGLTKGLFNLSQLSRELKLPIEVRVKRNVKESAILMALSRLQRSLKKKIPDFVNIPVENLTIQTGLLVYTFTKTNEIHQEVHKLFIALQQGNAYITICEGMHEITFIVDAINESRVDRFFFQKPKHHRGDIAALGLTFDEKSYIATPGIICLVLQKLLLQSINVIEVSSTYSGLTLYVAEEDAKLAFETLYGLLGTK